MNKLIAFEQLNGNSSYDSKRFYCIGLNYLYALNKITDIEASIEFANHRIIVNPNSPPFIDVSPYSVKFDLISLPVALRFNLSRYFFLSCGINVDLYTNHSKEVDSQNGIGFIFGAGLKYNFKTGISIFANPYFKAHSLIGFAITGYHERLMESGIRLGVQYKL